MATAVTAFSALNYSMLGMGITMVPTSSAGNFLTVTQNVDFANYAVDVDANFYTNLVANNSSTAKIMMQYGAPSFKLTLANQLLYRTTGIPLPSAFTDISGEGSIQSVISSAACIYLNFADEIFSNDASAMTREIRIVLSNTLRA